MNKIKSLAVAVTLAVAAGSAHAEIATGATGNGELFLTVWDSVGAQSYVRDLGTRVNDFGTLNAPAQTLPAPGSFVSFVDSAAGFSKTWGTDSVWATFIAGKTAAEIAAFRYDVYGMDTNGTSVTQGLRYLTTTNADMSWATTPGNQQFNSQVTNMNVVNGYLDAINMDNSQTAGQGDASTNGSAIFTSGSAYGGGGFKSTDWAGKATFNTMADVGTPVNFYYITRGSTVANGATNNTGEAVNYQYGNATGPATFLLANDGTLTYQVAAVPEAETWAMFGAGLLMLGAIARRRMAS